MNTNMMESMGGNGALGKRRRKKRTADLAEKISSKIDRTKERKFEQNRNSEKLSLFQLYLSKLTDKFLENIDGCL